MEINETWTLFGALIHQDFLLDYPDFYSGVMEVIKNFSPQQKEEIYFILQNLVTCDYSPAELSEIWRKSGAEIFVMDDEIKKFLSEILSAASNEIKIRL